jgi:hypothetical protein
MTAGSSGTGDNGGADGRRVTAGADHGSGNDAAAQVPSNAPADDAAAQVTNNAAHDAAAQVPNNAAPAADYPGALQEPARRSVLLRLSPPVYEAIARWARDDLRSVNAQIEFCLRQSLEAAGRAPTNPGSMPRRGRPPNAR